MNATEAGPGVNLARAFRVASVIASALAGGARDDDPFYLLVTTLVAAIGVTR